MRNGQGGGSRLREEYGWAALLAFALWPFFWSNADADGLFDDTPYEVTGILGVDSVAVFRGVKSRKLNPSVFAGLDLQRGDFFTGAETTPTKIAGETRPLIVSYAGYAPSFNKIDVVVGGRYYAFPASSPFEFDVDSDGVVDHIGKKGLFEGFVGGSIDVGEVSLRVRAFYSPDTFGEAGQSVYGSGSVTAPLGAGFEIRGHFGASRYANDILNDDYFDYRVGVSKSLFGLDFFLNYSDTFGLPGRDNQAIVFSVERAFTLASDEDAYRRRMRKIRNEWVIDKSLLKIGR